jgi:hypothetical protein
MITYQQFKNQHMHCILTSKSNAPTYVSASTSHVACRGIWLTCKNTVHMLVFKLLICYHNAGEYNMKFSNAQQAKSAYNYHKIKEKLHKTIASIWFNKICKLEKLSPKYIHITVNGNNRKSLTSQYKSQHWTRSNIIQVCPPI